MTEGEDSELAVAAASAAALAAAAAAAVANPSLLPSITHTPAPAAAEAPPAFAEAAFEAHGLTGNGDVVAEGDGGLTGR